MKKFKLNKLNKYCIENDTSLDKLHLLLSKFAGGYSLIEFISEEQA